MTIPKITPYSGGVANPDGSQTQTEFTQNMFDQLSYEAELSTELNSTVDGINDTAIQVDADAASAAQSAAAAEASASGLNYKGLWPDTGGSANKGDTYQTQVSGTHTGQYFTALQDTAVDPVGDDVNWREVVSNQSLGGVTNYQASSVADMISGKTVGWESGDLEISHREGAAWVVSLTATNEGVDDVAIYIVTNDPGYPRVDLGGGLYASRRYFGDAIKMNTSDWRMVEGGYRKPYTGTPGDVTSYEPYSQIEYDNAFWNAKSVQLAVEFADDNNISTVKTPNGEFTYCYHAPSATSPRIGRDSVTVSGGTSRVGTIWLENIKNVDLLDMRSTSFKAIYDSSGRNPYDYVGIQDGLNTYDMNGGFIEMHKTRNIKIINSISMPNLGDVYTRDWVNDNPLTDQTYGIFARSECYDIDIQGAYYGFTGDSISTSPRGPLVASLGSLVRGGFNESGVEDDSDQTKRRTSFIDTSGAIDDIVLTATTGYTRYPTLRTPFFGVYFYDSSQNFIVKEEKEHLDDIVVDGMTKYVRLEFYNDERTSEEFVNYGSFNLYTGFSGRFNLSKVSSRNNRRGAISNVPNDTVISDLDVNSAGDQPKLGTPPVLESTRYAINIEDTVVREVNLERIRVSETRNGALVNALSFTLKDSPNINNVAVYSSVKRLHVGNSVGAMVASRDAYKWQSLTFEGCNGRDSKSFSSCSIGSKSALDPNYGLTRVHNSTLSTLEAYGGASATDVLCVGDDVAYSHVIRSDTPRLFRNVSVDLSGISDLSYRYVTPFSKLDYLDVVTVRNLNAAPRVYPGFFMSNTSQPEVSYLNMDVKSNHRIDMSTSQSIVNATGLSTFNIKGTYEIDEIYTSNLNTPRPYHYNFEGAYIKLQGSILIRERGDGGGSTQGKMTFIGGTIDVSDMLTVVTRAYAHYGTTSFTLEFVNVTFINKGSQKTIELFGGVDTANLNYTSSAKGCTFINCSNNDGVTTETGSILL